MEVPAATITATTLGAVRDVLVTTLDVHDRADSLHAGTALLGQLPELDSMAVLELVAALEERFQIEVEGEEMTAEVFDTLGSLAAFVDGKLS